MIEKSKYAWSSSSKAKAWTFIDNATGVKFNFRLKREAESAERVWAMLGPSRFNGAEVEMELIDFDGYSYRGTAEVYYDDGKFALYYDTNSGRLDRPAEVITANELESRIEWAKGGE